MVVEVKPEARAQTPQNTSIHKFAKEILRAQGYEFLVTTDAVIRAQKRHDRAAILIRHARSHLPLSIVNETIRIAGQFPDGISIGRLASVAGVPITTILHLIGRRRMRINRMLDFSASQIVYPIGGDYGDLHA